MIYAVNFSSGRLKIRQEKKHIESRDTKDQDSEARAIQFGKLKVFLKKGV